MKEKTKFTPGPWSFEKDDPDSMYVSSDDADVAEVFPIEGETTANANLIAAAPELYECLREAIVEKCAQQDWEGKPYCPSYKRKKCTAEPGKCFVQKWWNVLKKAEGKKR